MACSLPSQAERGPIASLWDRRSLDFCCQLAYLVTHPEAISMVFLIMPPGGILYRAYKNMTMTITVNI